MLAMQVMLGMQAMPVMRVTRAMPVMLTANQANPPNPPISPLINPVTRRIARRLASLMMLMARVTPVRSQMLLKRNQKSQHLVISPKKNRKKLQNQNPMRRRSRVRRRSTKPPRIMSSLHTMMRHRYLPVNREKGLAPTITLGEETLLAS